MRTVAIDVKRRASDLYRYLEQATTDTKAMRNTANYYIRNTMTALSKDPDKRTEGERKVLADVEAGIHAANAVREPKYRLAMEAAAALKDPEARRKAETAAKKKAPFSMPSKDKWFLSYEVPDAVFKFTGNEVYRRMTSQVNQNAIRKTVSSWKSFFALKKDYAVSPSKYRAAPRIPGYIRDERATAWFSNQVSRLVEGKKGMYLAFANCGERLFLGPAHLYSGRLVKTEVQPYHGGIRVLVTLEGGAQPAEVPEHPVRIYGVDTGIGNLIAVANNTGSAPFLVKGTAVKSLNRNSNKERARLTSVLTGGKDSRHSEKHSRRLDSLGRKRDGSIRDFFYKSAHAVCRRAKADRTEVIVIGHNDGQKDSINIGHVNNQHFVSVPFLKLINAFGCVAAKYGIAVVVREESYTSKASLPDADPVPTYGKEGAGAHPFSGKRVKRGLYAASEGSVINADINGVGNIIRKEYPYAFDGRDLSYLEESVDVIGYRDIYRIKGKARKDTGRRHRPGLGARLRHNERSRRRLELKKAFGSKRKHPARQELKAS